MPQPWPDRRPAFLLFLMWPESPASSGAARAPYRSQGRSSLRATPRTRLKDDLCRRCLANLLQRRAALVSQSRQMAGGAAAVCQSVIREEFWRASADAATSDDEAHPAAILPAMPTAWTEEDELRMQEQLGRDQYQELMAATEEALRLELERDIASLGDGSFPLDPAAPIVSAPGCEYEQYEEFLRAEEDHMMLAHSNAMMDDLMGEGALSDDRVLCPLCSRGELGLSPDGWVRCSLLACGACQLALDARGAQSSPLELLRDRMCSLILEHSKRCAADAQCRLPIPGGTELHLGQLAFCCSVCGLAERVV